MSYQPLLPQHARITYAFVKTFALSMVPIQWQRLQGCQQSQPVQQLQVSKAYEQKEQRGKLTIASDVYTIYRTTHRDNCKARH